MLDLARDTIFVTLAGSQAHGTARHGSDIDLRGVCVAPLDVRVSLFHEFDQLEGTLDGELWAKIVPALERHSTASGGMAFKTEAVIFDISKFLRLCAAANPNALEVLFADEKDWLYETPTWRRLHRERERFSRGRCSRPISATPWHNSLQTCTTPGLDCLMPSCCDYPGLCVTPGEKAVICGGPDASRFECGP